MPREGGPAFTRTTIPFYLGLTGFWDQSGAVTAVLSYVVPFRCWLESIAYIPGFTGAGAGATHVVSVRKGNATGTVLAAITVTLANHVFGAAGITASVTAANDEAAKFVDNDTLSITKASGTVFSAAGGVLLLNFRQRLQARI